MVIMPQRLGKSNLQPRTLLSDASPMLPKGHFCSAMRGDPAVREPVRIQICLVATCWFKFADQQLVNAALPTAE